MTAMQGWVFPRNDADEDEGLANAGIEFFRDSPYSGIARECGQNSLDAVASDPTTGEASKVLLEFRKIPVARNHVPGIDQLRRTMEFCLDRAKARGEDKEVEFFARAIEILDQTEIDSLQISDSGTKGLRGPSTQGTPFHALVKASGVSEKSDKSAGGSFGIGKNAAYAISALRTVFYSTWYQDGATPQFLCQGKAILASHHGADGQAYRAAGYWGADGFQPVQDPLIVPEWLKRTVQGTTVSSLGFVGEDDWKYQVTESLARNFFAAVQRNMISFRVDKDIVVDHETIGELFHDEHVQTASDAHGYGEDLRFSRALHECLTSTDASESEETFEGLGRMRLRLLVRDGLPKRVALLRNGMYITDSLQHFGDKLARFALQKDFVAVLEPVDPDASHVVRRLENPRHDELSPERVEDRHEQRRVRSAFKKLIAWMRDVIRSETMSASESEILLDEMNQFFATPERSEPIPDDQSTERDPERPLIKPHLRRSSRPSRTGDEGEDGGGGGSKKGKRGSGRTSGKGIGRGSGGTGTRGGRSIPLADVRNLIPIGKSRAFRRVYFTPLQSGEACLSIFAPGISTREQLRLRTLDGVVLGTAPAVMTVSEGTRYSLDVELFVAYEGPIELALEVVGGQSDEAQ